MERGASLSCRLLRQHCSLALLPAGKARSCQDPVDVCDRARVAIRAHPGLGVTEIRERTSDGDVCQREAIAYKISVAGGHDLFQIVEDRREVVELRLLDLFFVARNA